MGDGIKEPTVAVAVQWREGCPVAVHRITCPGLMENGGYVQSTSLTAFRSHERDRIVENHRAGQHRINGYTVYQRPDDFERERIDMHGVSETNHENVFAFYDGIGYDYKAKRYTGQ